MVARMSKFLDAALVVLAIAGRVAAVLVLQSHLVPRSTYEHGEIAANLVAGRGFSTRFLGNDGPTSQQAPVYPVIVAAAYWLDGVENPRSLLLVELGQSVLGGLLVLGVLRLCRTAAPARPIMAWTAGLVVALHPTLVYAATHIQVATLSTTLLTWTLAWGYKTGASGLRRDAMITGALLALLALTDPILALALVGVSAAIWQVVAASSRQKRRALALIAMSALVALAGVAPWLARNFLVHGEFVAIKSTFGYAFWQGNCALSAGTDKVVRSSVERVLNRDRTSLAGWNRTLWEARHEAGYLDDIALSQADYRLLGSVSEPERSRILFKRALADLAADPARYPRLCLRRLRYFLLFDETNPKSRVLAYRLPHVALTLFAASGLLLAPPLIRRKLAPTLATAALVALFHALTIVSARFHLPVEPFLAIWGASGIARWERVEGSHSCSARHHIKGIGIVDRLAAIHRRLSPDPSRTW